MVRSERGFSLIMSLVAAAIVSTAAVGVTSLGVYLNRQASRAQMLNTAVALHAQITRSLMSEDQFKADGVRSAESRAAMLQMANGVSPTTFELYTREDTHQALVVTALAGQRTNYDINGQICITGNCPIYADVDISCAPGGGCQAALRVGIHPNKDFAVPSPIGATAPTSSGGNPAKVFATNDYSLALNYEFLERSNGPAVCQGRDMLVTGVNRRTGGLTCISRNLAGDVCPPNSISDTVRAANGRLVMSCRTLAQVRCPTNYVLQRFDFGQLDRGPGTNDEFPNNLNGRCVYRYRNDIPMTWRANWTTTGDTSTQQTCNAQVYDAIPQNCDVEIQPGSNQPGYCDDGSVVYSTVSATEIQRPAGENQNVGTCRLTITDRCGSRVTARSTWGGRCYVKERHINPTLAHAPIGGFE